MVDVDATNIRMEVPSAIIYGSGLPSQVSTIVKMTWTPNSSNPNPSPIAGSGPGCKKRPTSFPGRML